MQLFSGDAKIFLKKFYVLNKWDLQFQIPNWSPDSRGAMGGTLAKNLTNFDPQSRNLIIGLTYF